MRERCLLASTPCGVQVKPEPPASLEKHVTAPVAGLLAYQLPTWHASAASLLPDRRGRCSRPHGAEPYSAGARDSLAAVIAQLEGSLASSPVREAPAPPPPLPPPAEEERLAPPADADRPTQQRRFWRWRSGAGD